MGRLSFVTWMSALLILVAIGAVGAWGYRTWNASGAAGPLLPGGNQSVQLAWFYKPPTNGDMQSLQHYFDSFVLTAQDEQHRETLRAGGVSTPFLQYVRFDAIHDPASCTAQPWRNQVANRPGDYCRIEQEHPDWFLRDDSGTPIVVDTDTERFVLMDPGNPEWRAFWLERVRQDQQALGWDGVFLDNVEASLAKFERLGIRLQDYPTAQSYQDEVSEFLTFLDTSFFEPASRPLFANIVEVQNSDVWLRYLDRLDGVMDEGWVVDWSVEYLKPEQWETHLRRAEEAQIRGKQVILVSQGAQGDIARQRFAFASYLLVSSTQAHFRYTHADEYDEVWLYSNYDLDLGLPLGPRYRQGNVWQRDFTRGSVSVDPYEREATITLY